MTIKRRPIERAPTSPGDHLREYLTHGGLTQDKFAKMLKVSRLTVNELVNNRRTITPNMALRLERFTTVSAELWLKIQSKHDLWKARKQWKHRAVLRVTSK